MSDKVKTSRLGALVERVWDAARRHPSLASLALGLVAACGYPPLHLWWLSLIALAGFVGLLSQAGHWRAAAWWGWLFGWSHLTLANNWIATAFTYQAKMPEILGWFAVPLLCVYLAIYPAFAALFAWLLSQRVQKAAVGDLLCFGLLFSGAWIIFEWVRSSAFSGYPWPPLGLVLLGDWDTPGVAFTLPWLGTYGLSGLVVLLAVWVAHGLKRASLWRTFAPFAIVALAMHAVPTPSEQESDVAFTLVQPLITQDEINDGSIFEEQFARIADLTAARRDESRVVLWPESAIPDYLESGYPQRYYDRMTALNPVTGRGDPEFARTRIASVIGDRSTLLTGVVNLDMAVVEGRRMAVSARNSVIGIDSAGAITDEYAKAHLVPYGE